MRIDESTAVKLKPLGKKTVNLSIGADNYEVSYRQLSNEFSKLRIRIIKERYKNGSKKTQR